ncbi:MAG TPA: hypothetical protein VEX86_16660 [Longimicrobium sp.]|nr:hypothetical protein [Longimicrobium sp.]
MSTGGHDPNRDLPPDPDVARGNIGSPKAARLGMGSTTIALLAAAIAVAVILVAVF